MTLAKNEPRANSLRNKANAKAKPKPKAKAKAKAKAEAEDEPYKTVYT